MTQSIRNGLAFLFPHVGHCSLFHSQEKLTFFHHFSANNQPFQGKNRYT